MSQRFLTGNVHVATLMPMRAIPFRVVCLLGLNDNEFPRRQTPNDFDLLHAPALARPGDRSRSADDRYLFLEAILSARSHVLISWVGRSARSNAEKPPSLLVAQLRDYLYRGWQFSDASLSAITTEHALAPFSPRYFQGHQAASFAAMWRAANDYVAPSQQQPIAIASDELGARLPLSELMYFYRSPARYFYRQRLGVVFAEADVISPDHEPFEVDHLVRHQSIEALLRSVQQDQPEQALATAVTERVGRGEWPLAGFAEPAQAKLKATAEAIELLSEDWLSQRALAPIAAAYTQQLVDGSAFEVYADIHGVRETSAGQQILWVPHASKLLNDNGGVKRWEKLWPLWLQQLLLTLSGHPVAVSVLCPLGVIDWAPVELADAQIYWRDIVQAWRDGQDHALAFDVAVAAAYLTRPTAKNKDTDQTLACEKAAREAYEGSEFGDNNFAPITKPPMAMLWPDYAALSASNELAHYRDSLVSAMIYHIEPERREWAESSR
jgi:exodeoxyribonuclease V gamma subunit